MMLKFNIFSQEYSSYKNRSLLWILVPFSILNEIIKWFKKKQKTLKFMWLGATSLCVVPDLEATRNRLLDSERKKGELATQYQQRLEEVENLKR